jgi:hypothetical protein
MSLPPMGSMGKVSKKAAIRHIAKPKTKKSIAEDDIALLNVVPPLQSKLMYLRLFGVD